ncbi:MAG: flagellar hook-basal body complex protein [Candidatus Brocadiaceae bacterium]|nr:flagellar hook-basal body complex protein [Candidatus Brocadiaceae bacterium]
MGFGGALNSGVTGIRTHQTMLDVIGNNLANVNTFGFKSSRLLFTDLLSRSMAAGSGGRPVQIGMGVKPGTIASNFSQGALETTNNAFDFAIQGDGFFVVNGGGQNFFTRVGSFATDKNNLLVDTVTGYRVLDTTGEPISIPFDSTVDGKATSTVKIGGNLEATTSSKSSEVLIMESALTASSVIATGATTLNSLDSNTSDYIAGDKILITGTKSDGTTVSATYTIAAATDTVEDLLFEISKAFGDTGSSGSLNQDGDAYAEIDATGKIILKPGSAATANSDKLSVSLDDDGSNTGKTTWSDHKFSGSTRIASTVIYDTQGVGHTVTYRFTKQGDNTWNLVTLMASDDGTISDSTVTGITFNEDGSFSSTTSDMDLVFKFNGMTTSQTVSLDLGTTGETDGLSQMGGKSTAVIKKQDGYAYGSFENISVLEDGTIRALYSNGIVQDVAQMSVAIFSDRNGLERAGDNMYKQTDASGEAIFTTGGGGVAGSISSGNLEGSNVDMTAELTSLIMAQRGFQLNSRVVTTADEVIAEAVNLKR